MSSILNHIRDHIIANSSFVAGPSTAGTPIYLSSLPETIDDSAVVILASGGPGPLYGSRGQVVIKRPTVQIISRSSGYKTAEDNANIIWDILSGVTNQVLSGTNYLTITPLQSPTDMGQDAAERPLVTCNFMAEREP